MYRRIAGLESASEPVKRVEGLEFIFPTLGDDSSQFFIVIREKLKGCAGGPFLPHEEQGYFRQTQEERGGRPIGGRT